MSVRRLDATVISATRVVRATRVRRLLAAALLASALVAAGPSALVVDGAPIKYKNCAAMNAKYPHGVGKPGARDKVSGSTRPVTTFYRNLALYMANTGRDRDKDGIACEKL
jgi:hypothetical protein